MRAKSIILFVLFKMVQSALSLSFVQCDDRNSMSRRDFVIHHQAYTAVALLSPTENVNAIQEKSMNLASRFKSNILIAPPTTAGMSNTGHENLYFPDWLEGEWDATQTLVSTQTPLGLEYIGGPQGLLDLAQATIVDQTNRLNKPVSIKLRFVKTKFGIAEDRLFNTRNRFDAYADKSVVARIEYADVRNSNRADIVASGGTESDPLMTTVVYFKGPAAQKTFVISYGQEWDGDTFYGFEVDRSIFALTNTNTAPPVTTDTELLYFFKSTGGDIVEGHLRMAGYLNPQTDKLYFEAKNRAVYLNDFNLVLRKSY